MICRRVNIMGYILIALNKLDLTRESGKWERVLFMVQPPARVVEAPFDAAPRVVCRK